MTMTERTAEKVKLAIHKGLENEFELGGLRFRACRREVADIDGGVTLQVWTSSGDAERELLRFDCFRKAPHYHAPGENPDETKIDPERFGDGRDWVYEQLTLNARRLLEQSGWTPDAAAVDFEALGDLEPRLRELVDALPEPTETSYFEVDAARLAGNRNT